MNYRHFRASISTAARFKLFFVIQYLGVGIFTPYLALYLTSKGLSGVQLGLILGSMPLVSIISQPVWGILSDFFHTRRVFLVMSCILVGFISISLYWLDSLFFLLPVFLLYSALLAPVYLLGTAMALDYLEKGGQIADFGLLRLWGSAGFAVTALISGRFFLGTAVGYLPVIYGGIMLLLSVVAYTLPESSPQGEKSWWSSLAQFRVQSSLKLFLLGSLFIGFTQGVGMQYLVIYMESLQASGWLIGFAISLQAILEIPLMYYAPRWIVRYGIAFVLIAGVILLPLRWLSFVFINQPAWIIPIQLLHSMTIVSMMVVGVTYVDLQMRGQWRATGQGLYSTVINGIGPALGLFVAGVAYQQGGIRLVWSINTVVAMLGVLILASSLRKQFVKSGNSSG